MEKQDNLRQRNVQNNMKRSNSVQQLMTMLGPTQLQKLEGRKHAEGRYFISSLSYLVLMWAMGILAVVLIPSCETSLDEVPQLVWKVLTFERFPISAQDNTASLIATLLCLIPIWLFDFVVCRPFLPNSGSRWYLIHAVGNTFVCILSIQDFWWIGKNPWAALSVEYCQTLPSPACTEWPACIILAIHFYHVMAFDLNSNDIFHHALFVPVIGGIHFTYPWGCAGNVLCFFISGLPGGLDYYMLSAVKAGKMAKFTEKRINCSINTWIRGPGITAFCMMVLMCWLKPYPGTPPEDIMPTWLFLACGVVVFFNGQHYAQRVIGDYYIRKKEDYIKRGVKGRVELHVS